MIRILLADDHALVRQGVKQLLSFFDDMHVTGEAATGDEVLQMLAQNEFDIVLLDVTMPGSRSGARLVSAICALPSPPPVLVVSMRSEPQIARNKLEAGARGYLTKDCPPGMLEDAIRFVAAGGSYIQPDIAGKMMSFALAASTRLSPQELRILKLFADGLRVVDIANALSLSSRTVSTHKARLMQKLDIDNDAALIRYADAHGLK